MSPSGLFLDKEVWPLMESLRSSVVSGMSPSVDAMFVLWMFMHFLHQGSCQNIFFGMNMALTASVTSTPSRPLPYLSLMCHLDGMHISIIIITSSCDGCWAVIYANCRTVGARCQFLIDWHPWTYIKLGGFMRRCGIWSGFLVLRWFMRKSTHRLPNISRMV